MRPRRLSYQAAAAVSTARIETRRRASTPALLPAGATAAARYGGTSALRRQRRLAIAATLFVLHAATVTALLDASRSHEVAVDAAPVFLAVVDAPAPVAASRALPPPSAKMPPPPPVTLPAIAPEAMPAPLPVAPEAPAPPAPTAAVVPVENPPAPAPLPPRTIPSSAIQYIVPPAPVYSRISARMRESGKAVVRVLIDEAGLPRTVQLAASTGFARLDDAALAAVRNCRFKPWLDHGVAVAAWANIPIEFELPT
jgi:protein TonB